MNKQKEKSKLNKKPSKNMSNVPIYLLLLLLTTTSQKLVISGPKKLLKDTEGYYRVFHGANIAYKIPPYLPPIIDHYDPKLSFTHQDAAQLKSWGMNVIRLTFYWEGVEPKRGEYSKDYINSMKRIVEICLEEGIQVILDLHQDAASRYYCGEGIPDWAVERREGDFPKPLGLKMEFDEQGYPTLDSCLQTVFGSFYLSYGVERLFQDLYDDKRGLRTSFVNMWYKIASEFKDYENLIGYEIINEPWVGNIYEKPTRILFGGDENLYPLYKLVHDKIREIDQDSIVFFETATTDVVTFSLKKLPADEQFKDKLVHSYHLYCAKTGDPKSEFLCNSWLFAQDLSGRAMRRMWGVGGFMTEFGAVSGAKGAGLGSMDYLLDIVGRRFHSWTYWQYKYYNDYTTAARPSEQEGFFFENGEPQVDKLKVLARPYAHKICGEPLDTSWKNGVFEFSFRADQRCKEQSSHFFVSEEFHFINGFDVEVTGCENDGCGVVREEGKNWWKLEHQNAKVGGVVKVKITKK